jgi:cation diffusion facilitator CzcD-associated flavoprotein CzcO
MTGPRYTAGRDPRLDVVVIGAGQAGLAMAWHLAQRGLRFTILDAADEMAHSWRNRWDSLRLFTPAQYDALPGMAFPAPTDTYPGKDAVAAYLHDYAIAFDLPVRLGRRVTALERVGEEFQVHAADEVLRARQVVVATGPFQVPLVPAAAQGFDPAVTQIHSADYRNPQSLPAGPVLVVGAGNSGLQIAGELAATRQVDVSVGETATMLPQRLLGRDLFWWLTRLGFLRVNTGTRAGRRLQARAGRCPVPAPPRPSQRTNRAVRRRQQPRRPRRHLGHRLPIRLLLDLHSGGDRRRPDRAPARSQRHTRAVLRRPVLAVHPRLGTARVRRRRRRVPRRPDHRPCSGHRRIVGAASSPRTY